jgi:hypothetical protein
MLEQLVSWLAYGSLAIGALSAYLHLNKLWSRKHIQEVADSISISGTLLEAVPTAIFGLYFLTREDPVGVLDSLIWLTAAVGFIMIGSGFWVKGQRRQGIFRLAWRSLRSESAEVGNLAQALLHHESNEELAILLHRFAEVDGEVSGHEAKILNEFAADMNLDLHVAPGATSESRTNRLLNTRRALDKYLAKSPPSTQVEQLEHLLHRLMSTDGTDHSDELSSLGELKGAIRDYLSGDSRGIPFRVLLAPQSEEQVLRINSLLDRANVHTGAGGRGVTVGEFHTREFADTVCREYRDLGFFCVVTDEMVPIT